MKNVSVRDLQQFPELSKYSELDLIHPDMDSTIRPFLYILGIDTEYPIEYGAYNHRDLNNKTGIGYRLVGEIRCDAEFRKSPFCDTIDRVAITGYQDSSLTQELAQMMNHTVDFDAMDDEEGFLATEDFTTDMIEPDYEEVSAELQRMRKTIIEIRGAFVSLLEN